MNETELKQEVELLLADIDKTHRYSMSKIYELANNVFATNEKPQSCASCLIRKTRELRQWLDKENKKQEIVNGNKKIKQSGNKKTKDEK